QKALLGVIEYTGWPDRPGVGVPQAYSDYSTPWIGTAAVMAALEQRRMTGKGAHIELSHLEASSAFVPSHLLLQYTANRGIPQRQGNRTPEAVPCGAYPCQGDDRWCAVSVHGDEEWQALGNVVGLAWAGDARFATHWGREEHQDELDALLAAFTVNYRPHLLMAKLQGAGVRAGVVQNYAEILEQDPQTRHRGFFARLSRPELENVSHPGWPAKLSRTPAVLRPTPRVGEHTYAICKEVLNMPDGEFVRLLNAGVLEVST
ncbi:MAG: CoA transferase, partial [Chloroflexota bacterium]